MELHPLCTYFPRMSDDEFTSLKDSLKENGQTHPIYTLDGMILDGGNRYRALCELDIEPVMIEYTGTNPTQFILSSNLHRRHLTQGQSAAIVSASQSWITSQAENQLQLGTSESRAKQSGAGRRTQQLADKLVKEASEELIKEVIDGKKSLNKAIKEITPPKPIVPKTPTEEFETEYEEDHSPPFDVDEAEDEHKTSSGQNYPQAKGSASNDKLLASQAEVKKLTEANRVLNARIKELMHEKEEALKSAQYWKEKFLALDAKATT